METIALKHPWPLLEAASVLIVIGSLRGPAFSEAQDAAYGLALELKRAGYFEDQLEDLLNYAFEELGDSLDGAPFTSFDSFPNQIHSTVKVACHHIEYDLCSPEEYARCRAIGAEIEAEHRAKMAKRKAKQS